MLDRLVRAQLKFINGAEVKVTEASISSAVNMLGSALDKKSYSFTNERQVRLLRVSLFPELKYLLQSPTAPPPNQLVSSDLSPAGGMFLACLLLRQKLTNPAWFGDPDEQNQRWMSPSKPDRNAPTGHSLHIRPLSQHEANLIAVLTTGLSNDSSQTASDFNRFFDELGIPR
jgi:hypothetical protein